jgi:hypothetical protein
VKYHTFAFFAFFDASFIACFGACFRLLRINFDGYEGSRTVNKPVEKIAYGLKKQLSVIPCHHQCGL